MNVRFSICLMGAWLILNSAALSANGDSSCTVTVSHCSDSESNAVVARAYDEDDSVKWVAADDATISAGSSKSLSCSGDKKCYVAVEADAEMLQASGFESIDCGDTGYVAVVSNKIMNNSYAWYSGSCQ